MYSKTNSCLANHTTAPVPLANVTHPVLFNHAAGKNPHLGRPPLGGLVLFGTAAAAVPMPLTPAVPNITLHREKPAAALLWCYTGRQVHWRCNA
jgi:hypothetical protein